MGDHGQRHETENKLLPVTRIAAAILVGTKNYYEQPKKIVLLVHLSWQASAGMFYTHLWPIKLSPMFSEDKELHSLIKSACAADRPLVGCRFRHVARRLPRGEASAPIAWSWLPPSDAIGRAILYTRQSENRGGETSRYYSIIVINEQVNLVCSLPYFLRPFQCLVCKRFGKVKHDLLHRSVDQLWRNFCFLTVCHYRLRTVLHVTYKVPRANCDLSLQPSFDHIFDAFRDISFKFCECNPTTISSTAR